MSSGHGAEAADVDLSRTVPVWPGRERGSAVLVLMLLGVLLTSAVWMVQVWVTAALTRQRAQAAADLAALSAARAQLAGVPDVCRTTAVSVATANRPGPPTAVTVGCRTDGRFVEVQVRVVVVPGSGPGSPAVGSFQVGARARAGPVTAPGSGPG